MHLYRIAKSPEIALYRVELGVYIRLLKAAHRLLVQAGKSCGGGLTQPSALSRTVEEDCHVNGGFRG